MDYFKDAVLRTDTESLKLAYKDCHYRIKSNPNDHHYTYGQTLKANIIWQELLIRGVKIK